MFQIVQRIHDNRNFLPIKNVGYAIGILMKIVNGYSHNTRMYIQIYVCKENMNAIGTNWKCHKNQWL